MSYSSAIEQEIGGGGPCYPAPEGGGVLWRAQEAGQQLEPLAMPITVTRCVFAASATRDFSPLHHNRDYAQRRANRPDMFVNTPFLMGMASRYATDWAGPRSRVRALRIKIKGAICAGEDLIVSGQVTGWVEDDCEDKGQVVILVSFATARGAVTQAEVVLALPRESDEHEGDR